MSTDNDKPKLHRVYLRTPDQKVSEKTTTESAEVAEFAYHRLVARPDLAGKEIAVAWTFGGIQQAFHDFKAPLASIASARRRLESGKPENPA